MIAVAINPTSTVIATGKDWLQQAGAYLPFRYDKASVSRREVSNVDEPAERSVLECFHDRRFTGVPENGRALGNLQSRHDWPAAVLSGGEVMRALRMGVAAIPVDHARQFTAIL